MKKPITTSTDAEREFVRIFQRLSQHHSSWDVRRRLYLLPEILLESEEKIVAVRVTCLGPFGGLDFFVSERRKRK